MKKEKKEKEVKELENKEANRIGKRRIIGTVIISLLSISLLAAWFIYNSGLNFNALAVESSTSEKSERETDSQNSVKEDQSEENGTEQKGNSDKNKEAESDKDQTTDLNKSPDEEQELSDDLGNTESEYIMVGPGSTMRMKNLPSEKTAYLTFDDGPSKNTEQILDILKEFNIKATFFVTGDDSEFAKDMYKRMANEGHAIGNHSYTHIYRNIYSSIDAYLEDHYRMEKILYQTVGIKPDIIRFPGGSNNKVSHEFSGPDFMYKLSARMLEEGYEYIDWNVSSRDASAITQDKEIIVDAVLEGVKDREKPSAIVLFHDSKSKTTTVEALPEIVETLLAEGYKFDILSQSSFNVKLR